MNEPLYNKPNEVQENSNNINNNPSEYQNPSQNQVPPQEQPYYSSQNPTQNPLNSQQIQPILPPSQVYYSPPQYVQNPQPQPQPYYPSPQGVPPVQQIPNNPTQNNGIYVQTQGITQNKYQNYQNISQVKHRGISQKDKNTFYIAPSLCSRCFPLLFSFVGIFAIVYGIINYSQDQSFGLMIGGLIFFVIGLFIFFIYNKKIYFIMGPNTLSVIKVSCCTKKAYIYNPGQLQKVEFIYRYENRNLDDSGSKHHYEINIVLSNGEVINLYSITGSTFEFTLEEIDYFLYFVNNHIQNNMRV